MLEEYVAEYDFNREVLVPREELLGIEQQLPCKGIIKLKGMARFLPIDGDLFQRILHHTGLIQRAHDSHKNCERPFNLLKNQTGLETIRVRSQHTTMARLHTD